MPDPEADERDSFGGDNGRSATQNEVIGYLRALEGEARAAAEEYDSGLVPTAVFKALAERSDIGVHFGGFFVNHPVRSIGHAFDGQLRHKFF